MTRIATGADSAPSDSSDPWALCQRAADPTSEREVVIAAERAGVRLGGRAIWREMTFEVRSGECIAVLGPNGAGKSTLLKALSGLVPLSEGEVRVLGTPTRRGNAQIGYLPQRHSFDADVRVRGRDVVRLGLDGRRWGIPLPGLRRLWGGDKCARQAAARVEEVIELVGASSYANRPIGELSGGEQQRLLIAQALVNRPRLLLLDEPLESLDLNNQQIVAALIRRVSQDQQVAVLLVAHDVNPILPYLDRVIYIGRGQTAIGAPQEVITSETLSRLYDAPIEVLRTRDGRVVVVGQPEEVSYRVHRPR
ncbi:MAG TPA: metal ABC transporter ATP-binding protein [Ktedonobacterales bacterium]|jgi:zinc/manganese transport system ATP-binding protein